MLFMSSHWEKDASAATWLVLVQGPEAGGVGRREHRGATSQGFGRETAFA